MRCLLICLMILLFSGQAALGAKLSYPNTLDSQDIRQRLLASLKAKGSKAAEPLGEIEQRNRPFVVFVPGILGSGLLEEGSGDVLWGKSQLTNSDIIAKKLAFCSGVKVTPYVLKEFEIAGGLANAPVYGRWLDELRGAAETLGADYEIFPYDWRQNIRDIAERFQGFLKDIDSDKLLKRPVIIIAHSMGGLVVNWWHKIYRGILPNGKKINISRVMYLGTPHAGAPAMAKVLMLGYERSWPNPFISFFADYKKHFVKALNKVGHTFPSLYQLLPHPEEKFIKYFGQDGVETKDHFKVDVWTGYNLLNKSPADSSICGDPTQDLERLLKEGKNFYDELYKDYATRDLMPRMTFYFSKLDNSTPQVLKVDANNKWEWIDDRGDERVLVRSAIFPYAKFDKGNPQALAYESEKHGDLLNNKGFVTTFVTILEIYQQRRDSQVFRLSEKAEFPELKVALKEIYLSPPENLEALEADDADFKIASIKKEFQNSKLFKNILEHNLRVLAKGRSITLNSPEAGRLLFDTAWNWKFGKIAGADARRQQINRLLVSGVVSVPNSLRAEAGNSLIHMAIEKKNTQLSASWHSVVKPFIPAVPMGKASIELVKAFQNNTKWLQVRGHLRDSINQ